MTQLPQPVFVVFLKNNIVNWKEKSIHVELSFSCDLLEGIKRHKRSA